MLSLSAMRTAFALPDRVSTAPDSVCVNVRWHQVTSGLRAMNYPDDTRAAVPASHTVRLFLPSADDV